LAEINWTQEAEAWLRDIHDFIVIDNPEAALELSMGFLKDRSYSNSTPNWLQIRNSIQSPR